jgi:hypothetical protein
LLEAGLKWIAALAEPQAPADVASGRGNRAPRITTDPLTGERSLTLPMPEPASLQGLLEGLTGLLAHLRRTD